MIKFEVLGEVHGKGRPRFVRMKNYVSTYTDKTTATYENLVKLSFIQSKQTPYQEGLPLKCNISVYQTPPKSTSKKNRGKMIDGLIYPTKKPDCDNIAKIILDALNKVAYYDDTQIIKLQVSKQYAEEDKVIIEIEEVEHE